MNKKTSAYSTTSVPVSKSQEAIRRMLFEHKAQGVTFHEEPGFVGLRFSLPTAGGVRIVKTSWVVPPAPERKRKRHTRYVRGTVTATKGDWERQDQQVRMTYRSLYYWLKSQFDALDHGFRTFDQVFLYDIEYTMEGGRVDTIGNILSSNTKLLGSPQDNNEDIIDGIST